MPDKPHNLSTSRHPDDRLWMAICLACINALMLAGMSLFSKLLSHYFGPIEVTFFRNFFSLVALVIWLVIAGKMALMKTDRPLAQLFRASIGTAGIAFGMWAISLLPLTEVTILLFTSPLFTLLLSILILKERVGPYRLAAVLTGFLGVIIVADPFSKHMSIPALGLFAGLGWGFFSGAVDTTLRWIGRTENAATTTFYFMLFGSLTVGLHLPFAEFKPGAFSMTAFILICGLGLCGLFSQISKSQSFRFGEATLIAPIMYTMIIWSLLFDYLFWQKIPQANTIIGGAIIIGANLFILYREVKKRKTAPKSPQAPATD